MGKDEFSKRSAYAQKACGKDGINGLPEDNNMDVIIGAGDGMLFLMPSLGWLVHLVSAWNRLPRVAIEAFIL